MTRFDPSDVETTPFEVNGAHWTRHRLKALSTDNRALKISLESLELQFAETFFSRPARLSVPEGPAGETRVILSTILARNAGGGDRIVLNVGGPPSSEWILEIDEGDNAPLGAPTAAGVVGVPRAVFKAGPGTYALLLGDDQAQAPRYDIASLREEVLAYSATVVTPGPLTANPRFRRHIGAYFSEEPSIIGLWVAVLGGVVVLLVLTGRILGSPPRPS